MKNFIRLSFTFFSAVVLSACGGSSGGSQSSGQSQPVAASNTTPVANAGEDIVELFSSQSIELNGTASRDADGDSLTYSWSVTSQPSGSDVTLQNSSSPTAIFRPTQAGVYSFTLVVTDSSNASSRDTVTVTLNPPPPQSMDIYKLERAFGDAEYDTVNHRVIYLSGQSLIVVNRDGATREIPVPLPSSRLSIAPDGQTVAVSHETAVSHVHLDSGEILNTVEIDFDFGPPNNPSLPLFTDVVMGKENYAYLFSSGQNPPTVAVDLVSGNVSIAFDDRVRNLYGINPIEAESLAKLSPDGETIYSIGLNAIERLKIMGPDLLNLRYDGDFNGLLNDPSLAACPDIWMGIDGDFLTACHFVWRASNDPELDRDFIFRLGETRNTIEHASASKFNRNWYIIDTGEPFSYVKSGSEKINVYDVDTGRARPSIDLPNQDSGAEFDWIAKYVFASQTSDALFILAVDNAETPNEHALLVYNEASIRNDMSNIPPVANVPRYLSSRVGTDIVINATESHDPEGDDLSYQWSLIEKPEASELTLSNMTSETLGFAPDVKGVYNVALRVNDGNQSSPVSLTTLSVFDAEEAFDFRLDTGAIDAVFNKTLNAMVYLSDETPELIILDLENNSRKTVPLDMFGIRLGLSPDKNFAAVSHDNLITLVDLRQAMVVDTQITALNGGSLVLDQKNHAHMSPSFNFFESLYSAEDVIYSIDFEQDKVEPGSFAYKNSELKIHPTWPVIYGTSRGISPADIYRWDISSFPNQSGLDSPYHGDYDIGFNLWMNEAGDDILTNGTSIFQASTDVSFDMIYKDTLGGNLNRLYSADHSAAKGRWVTTTRDARLINEDDLLPTVFKEYYLFEDISFEQLDTVAIDPIRTLIGNKDVSGHQISFSENGDKVHLLMEASGINDSLTVRTINFVEDP